MFPPLLPRCHRRRSRPRSDIATSTRTVPPRAASTRAAIAAIAALTALAACTPGTASDPHADGLHVYATTGYLADAVVNIAPEARVTTMVGPGGDPHTYQPSTRDIETLQQADLVLWNGLYLEAHMIDQLSSLGERQLAAGEEVPPALLLDWPETDAQGRALHDPHVWNSPEAWTLVVGAVADKLAEIDPPGAPEYARNAREYVAQIQQAADDAGALLAQVPPPRILITGHDAFNYFGQTFGFEVYATDFISTDAALSAGELSDLARFIADNEVPVIFQDNQANPQAITSLKEAVRALGWEVEISAEELFADTLGAQAPLDTYLGVFAHNAVVVANALTGVEPGPSSAPEPASAAS